MMALQRNILFTILGTAWCLLCAIVSRLIGPHVIPNELYGSEWLEEGKAYPEALTDYIELHLKASLQGSGPASVAGSYQVKAVLEGYQRSGENRQIIYDKEFPLRDGKITQTDDGQAELEETIQIPLAPYREQAQRAEQILCTSVAKDLYLSFSGNFTINTASEKKEQDFTYQISLPIGTGFSIYQITKPDPFSGEGKITETQEGKKPINFRNILLSLFAGAVGLALLLFACFFTRSPDAEEAWRTEMNRILRKYGSRMTRLEQLPDPKHKECIYVADIESMDVVGVNDTMLEDIQDRDDALRLRRLVSETLTPREAEIIRLRYGLGGTVPLTQREVAVSFKISRSYVSRLETKALAKLREAFKNGEGGEAFKKNR